MFDATKETSSDPRLTTQITYSQEITRFGNTNTNNLFKSDIIETTTKTDTKTLNSPLGSINNSPKAPKQLKSVKERYLARRKFVVKNPDESLTLAMPSTAEVNILFTERDPHRYVNLSPGVKEITLSPWMTANL